MKKFSIFLILVGVFSLIYAQEADLKGKKRFFYLHQNEEIMKDKDFLQAYTSLEKLYEDFKGEEFIKRRESLQDSIFSKAIYCQENFNADKAVECLKFYVLNFEEKKSRAYGLLSEIYAKAGEKKKSYFYSKKAREFN